MARRLAEHGHPDKPIAPASPWQNGFSERLIGSIRHECLDHVIIRVKRICVGFCDRTQCISIKSGHIGLWTKMRRSGGQFSGPDLSLQIRSLADFITTTSESRSHVRFSVRTGGKILAGAAWWLLHAHNHRRDGCVRRDWLAHHRSGGRQTL